MSVTIISVGKLKEKYLKMGIEEYVKRLNGYTKIDLVEVPDEKAPEQLSDAEMEIVKKKKASASWRKFHKMPTFLHSQSTAKCAHLSSSQKTSKTA